MQVAERFIRATDQEAASAILAQELRQPYGLIGTWKTTVTDVDFEEVSERNDVAGSALKDSLLVSVKDSATHLRVPTSAES